MNEQEFLAEVRQVVSRDNVLQDAKVLDDYARDAVRQQRWGLPAPQRPLAIVRPASTAHVADILKLATQAGVPVVPYGGGTGVMGGAVTLRPGLVLDMGAMNKVIDVSLEDRVARVQPGVVLKDLDGIAQIGGFFLGHDPWSQPVATVGGAISTNGVGYLAAKYGPMGRQVVALEVALPTGEVVRTPMLPRPLTAGLDLTSLFIGTEGTFGVITEATVRIFPEPEERRHYALEFPSFPQGFFAIARLCNEGIQPAMVDFAEEDESPHGGQRIEADAPQRSVLHLSLEGGAAELDVLEQRTWDIVAGYDAKDMGPEEAQLFWERRHVSGEQYAQGRAAGQRHPWQDAGGRGFAYIHTAVPISKVLELRYKAIRMFDQAGLRIRECAIWGEPEMFSVMAYDPENRPDGAQRIRETSDRMMELALEMGGTIEYCHGIGLRLKHLMPRQLGDGGMALVRRLKAALDPSSIMNPGKLID